MTTPILTISVPTYNRADRLRVMLQALLPQVAECAGKVEVCISDNGSNDETAKVVEEARALGPLRYSRNDKNIGLVSNVLKAAIELPQGEFVWVLGDDDLLTPNALAHVVSVLEANRSLQLINVNFQHAMFAESWPSTAVGGYDGYIEGVVNAEMSDRRVAHWYELISAENSMCCQVYTNIIRASVWRDYWADQPRKQDFAEPRWSYPHSYMIAETIMSCPSFHIGRPVVTIFTGAQSWIEQRYSAVFKLAGILRAYERNGLPRKQVIECEKMVYRHCEPLLTELFQARSGSTVARVFEFLRYNWMFPEAWRTLSRVSVKTGNPPVYRTIYSVGHVLSKFIRRVKASMRYRFGQLWQRFFPA